MRGISHLINSFTVGRVSSWHGGGLKAVRGERVRGQRSAALLHLISLLNGSVLAPRHGEQGLNSAGLSS